MSQALRATFLCFAHVLALGGAAALSACEEVVPTTQIIIVVDAEESLRPSIDRIVLQTAQGTEALEQGELSFPFSFSLVPSNEELTGRLTIQALDEDGMQVVRRDLELSFRSRRTLSYGVALTRECAEIGFTCSEDETCVGCEGCDLILVDTEELIPLRYASQAIATWEGSLYCPSAPE